MVLDAVGGQGDGGVFLAGLGEEEVVVPGEDDALAVRREGPIAEPPSRTPGPPPLLTLTLALLAVLELLVDARLAVAVLPPAVLDHLLLALHVELLILLVVVLPLPVLLALPFTLALALAAAGVVPLLFLLPAAVLAALPAPTTAAADLVQDAPEEASAGPCRVW